MLPRSLPARLAAASLFLAFATSPSFALDWPQWLGPNRDGVWKEEGVLETFPKDGPQVLWKKPIGPGYSGPAVVGDRVFVMDRVKKEPDPKAEKKPPGQPGTERVLCLDYKTGDTVWTHEYDCTYLKIDRPMGPRTTPAVDGDRVYTLGTMGDLCCLEAKTGKPIWSKSFKKDYNATPPIWGFSAHLLIDKDLVFALVGGEGKAVVAFDKMTGKERWTALTSEDVGYSAPVIVEAGGVRQLIVWLSDSLSGLNPANGEVYWQHAHPEKGKPQQKPTVTISTPKVDGDMVYVSSAYDGMLALKLAKDAPSAEILWREEVKPKNTDSLRVLMTSIVARDGHLYCVGADTGEVVCAEAKTGKVLWKSKDLFGGKNALFGTAFWVEQGDRLFTFTDTGDLVILKLTPKQYEELGRAHIIDPVGADRGRTVIWSHPAFAQKKMVVRNEKEIVCVSLAKS
jgi:outer membrane protein assembly factor BamB